MNYNPKAILKAINRYCRKNLGKGWDYATWTVVYPQMAFEFSRAAEAMTGRKGRYLPKF